MFTALFTGLRAVACSSLTSNRHFQNCQPYAALAKHHKRSATVIGNEHVPQNSVAFIERRVTSQSCLDTTLSLRLGSLRWSQATSDAK